MENEKKLINLDTIINKEIGGMGKFQITTGLLLLWPIIHAGAMTGEFLFTSGRLPHRCAIPECEDFNTIYAPSWIFKAVPESDSGDIHDCERYLPLNITDIIVPDDDVCPSLLFDTNQRIQCESYVYERTNTVVYDFGLECNEWLRTLTTICTAVGSIFGLLATSYISDRWGRKTVIIMGALGISATAIARSFSVNYGMYVTFHFLGAAVGSGLFGGMYILAAEIVGTAYRVPTSAFISSSMSVGQVILGLLAWSIPAWRHLTLVHAPACLIIVYYWILPESARWMFSKNKFEETREVLSKMARMNGRTISEETLNSIFDSKKKENFEKKPEQNLLSRILDSPIILRRCLVTPIWWFTSNAVYYGLSINSVGLSGNIYLNYIITSAIEIPGYWSAVLTLNRIGRKYTIFTGFMISSVCCIAFAFIPSDLSTLSLVFYCIGKFGIAAVFTSIYLYTSELYPTTDRHKFIGYCSTIGRIGSILAGLSPALMVYWSGIPTIIFGSLAFIAALSVLTQPDTLGIKLPDSLAEAALIGRKNIN